MVGIGFFAPLPLALMMPFMAGQSLLMGESFGKGFQYGKRKISSMSNEEFNKMTAADLGREIATDYDAIIPSLEQAVRASTDFQRMIFQEMGEVLKLIPSEILRFFGLEGIEPGTDTDKISFNISQVRAWTDTELRAAFENKQNFALYDGITQIFITDEYNKRFIGTEPDTHEHTPDHHPVIEPEPTDLFLNQNSQGRVTRKPDGRWDLHTNNAGTWKSLGFAFVTMSAALTKAIATWPTVSYAVYPRKSGVDDIIYFILKTKLT